MTVDEFFRLPETTPLPIPFKSSLGWAPPKVEGEGYLKEWQTPDAKPWWTVTIDGQKYRQTYEEKV